MGGKLTIDKRRAELYERWIGHLPAEEVARKIQTSRRPAPAAPPAPHWRLIGPTNIGGRLTCLAVDPGNPKALWAGAAGGGVWHTPDAGVTWEPRWKGREATFNIGSLVVDPTHPNVLYCGTGEANLVLDSYPGAGVFRTRNGGKSWALVAPADASKAGVPVPRHIGSMAIDKGSGTAPDTIWLAGVRNDDSEPMGGLFSSTDDGVTWDRHDLPGFGPDESYQAHTVLARGGEIVVGVTIDFEEPDPRAGLWYSADRGVTWSQVWSGGDEVALGRVALARCSGSPKRVYALLADGSGGIGSFLTTADGGASWLQVAGLLPADTTMVYNCTLVVHPTDPDRIIFGGIDLFESRDRGEHWSRLTHWKANRGELYYAHADHHDLAWVEDGQGGTILYDANDGGLDISSNGGTSFANRSEDLPVTQLYDVEVAGKDGEILGGGCQDNGTVLDPGSGKGIFETITFGDGGWLALGADDDPHRWVAAALTFPGFQLASQPGKGEAVRYRDLAAPEGDFEFWVIPVEIHPARRDVVFTASDAVYRSVDFGDSWQDVTGSLDGTAVTALRVSPTDPDRIYATTERGSLFRSDDGGSTWSYDLIGKRFGRLGIADLCCAPANGDDLHVCLRGFAGSLPRVHHSTDGGWSWEEIKENGLPTLPLHAIVLGEDGKGKRCLAVAGAAGVWKRDEGTGTFSDVSGNLPRVLVTDLVWHRPGEQPGTWTAATYGRGLWRADAL